MRLNADGTNDTGFNRLPIVAGGTGAGTINTLHLQPDGKILVVGEFKTVNGVKQVGIARLNP